MSNKAEWEKNIRRVVPYTPGEQPKESRIIKLNTNENPYPPSPKVQEILSGFDLWEMRLYPDPDAAALVEAIAERYGVGVQNVYVGVGSDDVLSTAFMTFFNSERPLLFPDITYSFYDVWAQVHRIPYSRVPLTEGFRIDPKDYTRENGGIIFPNPNAPTGVFEDISLIEDIVKANPGSIVIIDEAYIDFGGESCLKLTKKYDNLLVVQTFSKSRSMAGMRIGFAIGDEKLIKYMNDVKFSLNSYTMNKITVLCGAAAIKDEKHFQKYIGKIIKTREKTEKRLTELGFTFPDPKSNFIFAKHKTVPAKEIFERLREKKIYVRYWDKPLISDHLRITIGTDEEMEVLFDALGQMIGEG